MTDGADVQMLNVHFFRNLHPLALHPHVHLVCSLLTFFLLMTSKQAEN